ncbi:MAG TPA: hypothetical protein VNL17_14715 [Verrucomicrobiae bacterium]|nr:hypothetical protein [Verrucomicrobiae bacterium]
MTDEQRHRLDIAEAYAHLFWARALNPGVARDAFVREARAEIRRLNPPDDEESELEARRRPWRGGMVA